MEPTSPSRDPSLWHVFAQSIRGTIHQRKDLPGQDAHAVGVLEDRGILVAAVADGAGSNQVGDLGSRTAATTAVETVLGLLRAGQSEAAELVHGAMREARDALEREATRRSLALDQLATTLVLVIADLRRVITGQIGDGFATALDRHGQVLGHSKPQNGEFANETRFLTGPHALEEVVVEELDAAPGCLILTTDGLQRLALKLPEREPHAPFFQSLYRCTQQGSEVVSQQLGAFLSSPRLKAKTNDDLSLLMAWNTPFTPPEQVPSDEAEAES